MKDTGPLNRREKREAKVALEKGAALAARIERAKESIKAAFVANKDEQGKAALPDVWQPDGEAPKRRP